MLYLWEIADIIKISNSIKLLMKMKEMYLLFYRKKNRNFLVNPIFFCSNMNVLPHLAEYVMLYKTHVLLKNLKIFEF